MFGRSDSTRDQRYLYWGLKRRTNAEAREEFTQEVDPLIEQIGPENPRSSQRRQYL
jgi:1,2-phenylacetyl-CoA epoxidase catalytic subunit